MNRQRACAPALSRLRTKNRKRFPSRHSFTRSTRIVAYLSDLRDIVKTFFSKIAHVVTTVQGSEHRSCKLKSSCTYAKKEQTDDNQAGL
jgi:hypothetical protein